MCEQRGCQTHVRKKERGHHTCVNKGGATHVWNKVAERAELYQFKARFGGSFEGLLVAARFGLRAHE